MQGRDSSPIITNLSLVLNSQPVPIEWLGENPSNYKGRKRERKMKKLCPGCGVVFEGKNNNNFCSEKCQQKFVEISFIGRGTKNKPHFLKFLGKSNKLE